MNRIKERRQELNLTRKALSDISTVPLRTLEEWESGRRIPRDIYQIKKVANALKCTMEDIIDFSDVD